jgi:hypothetical protein
VLRERLSWAALLPAQMAMRRVPFARCPPTLISGNGVFYPDKTPTQRIGIVPDVELKPTMRESVPAGTRSWRKPCVMFTASANYALPCCENNLSGRVAAGLYEAHLRGQ